MTNTDDQLFKHATEIAERRIRTAQTLQSREVARFFKRVLAKFHLGVDTSKTVATNRS